MQWGGRHCRIFKQESDNIKSRSLWNVPERSLGYDAEWLEMGKDGTGRPVRRLYAAAGRYKAWMKALTGRTVSMGGFETIQKYLWGKKKCSREKPAVGLWVSI